jgi:hypothetical protein
MLFRCSGTCSSYVAEVAKTLAHAPVPDALRYALEATRRSTYTLVGVYWRERPIDGPIAFLAIRGIAA